MIAGAWGRASWKRSSMQPPLAAAWQHGYLRSPEVPTGLLGPYAPGAAPIMACKRRCIEQIQFASDNESRRSPEQLQVRLRAPGAWSCTCSGVKSAINHSFPTDRLASIMGSQEVIGGKFKHSRLSAASSAEIGGRSRPALGSQERRRRKRLLAHHRKANPFSAIRIRRSDGSRRTGGTDASLYRLARNDAAKMTPPRFSLPFNLPSDTTDITLIYCDPILIGVGPARFHSSDEEMDVALLVVVGEGATRMRPSVAVSSAT